MSDDQKNALWERWRSGESISEIGRAMGKPPGSVYTILRTGGGVYRPPRRRKVGHLTLQEREEISRGLARGESMRKIAARLGRSPSTISREIARNKGCVKYRAIDAHDRAWYEAKRVKPCKLDENQVLADFVRDRLEQDWSPEQISGFLSVMHPNNPAMRVSHETIYKTLYIQSRGVLARELTKHLRTHRPIRKHKRHSVKGQTRSQIADAVSIHDRPAEIEDRAVPGHWEGDLVLGRGLTQMATLVERTSRFTVLVQLDGRDMTTVSERIAEQVADLPKQRLRSLTWDRGMELASHKNVTRWTGLNVYFADPRSPWQRGTNENTNGLLRQYFPKGTSLADVTQEQLDTVANKLNTRPRKTLDYRTPATIFDQVLR